MILWDMTIWDDKSVVYQNILKNILHISFIKSFIESCFEAPDLMWNLNLYIEI